jgi:aryl-alcohol dehydrogenase-like predicted oxidoreductase
MHTPEHTRRSLLHGALLAGASLPALAAAGAPNPTATSTLAQLGEAVHRRRIPRTGELVPCIGLGTSRTLDVDPNGDLGELVDVMRTFLAAGGSVIDSSPMYGRAEAVIGKLVERLRRDDLFFATKVWTDKGKDAGIAQMETSARLMGAQRIDLMQIHNLVDYATHLETLRAWRAEGRVRYIGATEMKNWTEVERLIVEDGVDFVQIPYSMIEREVEARILPAAKDHGVAVLVMRPFQVAGLFDKVEGKPLPDWAAEFDCTSWAQFFLKWVLAHPAVTCPIPATSKVSHLVDNMRAGTGRLPDEDMRKRMLAHLEL